MKRVRRTLASAVTLVVASTTLTACFEEPTPHDAVRDFLVGWQSEDYTLAAGRTDGDPATVSKALAATKLDLDAASFRFKVKSLSQDGDEAKATFGVEIDLGENVPLWGYTSTLPLHRVGGQWKVRWSPSVLHPKLKDGQRLAVKTEPRPREPINDRTGEPLQSNDILYVAGVTPDEVGNQAPRIVAKLAEITDFPQDRLLSRIQSSPPSDFVPLVTFGRSRYNGLKSRLDEIEQLQVHPQDQPVRPEDPKDIIGKVTALTPEREQKLGGPQRAGDSVGLNGLQAAYQDSLTGSTQIQVITLDLKTGKQADLLQEWQGRVNSAVTTTIDSGVQHAAENAVLDTDAAALVAVQASSGEIRAVATKTYNQATDALAGSFPPGTTFSIVAADALLKAGVKPSQKLPCPAERTVGGAKFEQASQTTGATPTVQENFARGCVTALAALARRVNASALTQSATNLGIGVPWKLPLNSFTGTMPALDSDAAKAKAIAGQNVEVSPLSMALVAGAVASGTWHPPVLVTAPTTPDPAAAVVPAAPLKPVPLQPSVRTTLKSMMRAGTSGTARAAQAGSSPVYGVSSTVKDLTWFVGWQGDVAVAVLAKNSDAAAVAGRFFGSLGSSR
ncbi:penicillin-binding transpeptidase domain-containing protein [Nonomuraea sediminis]|uniref:penicillin-binding transpeptidase domain-containing protein n=1 Tax=Nonomuraea sediminis TaxID=2835864 RepID=UPI001BDD4365|nr:penicillin-binding transpeptidase domain-containing protein [Nonomuraea sediminis]